MVIGVCGETASTGVVVVTLDTPTAETSCHCTPVTVEVRTCPEAPVPTPSLRLPGRLIPDVAGVPPLPLNSFVPDHTLLPKDCIVELAEKVVAEYPINCIPIPVAVLPAARTSCNVGIEADGIPVAHSTPAGPLVKI